MTATSWLVTGVTSSMIDARLSSVWVSVVHEMARHVGGRVVGASSPQALGRNHYRLTVELPDVGCVWVLLNAAIRLVGCQQQGEPGALALPFGHVQCGDLYELAGLRVAMSDELERPVSTSDLGGLTPGEVRTIEYHRPGRVGDVIYNWFD